MKKAFLGFMTLVFISTGYGQDAIGLVSVGSGVSANYQMELKLDHQKFKLKSSKADQEGGYWFWNTVLYSSNFGFNFAFLEDSFESEKNDPKSEVKYSSMALGISYLWDWDFMKVIGGISAGNSTFELKTNDFKESQTVLQKRLFGEISFPIYEYLEIGFGYHEFLKEKFKIKEKELAISGHVITFNLGSSFRCWTFFC